MADRDAALEPGDDGLVGKNIAHQADAAVSVKLGAVVGHDAGSLLSPVLQCVQAEGDEGRRLAVAIDAEDGALLVQVVAVEGIGRDEVPHSASWPCCRHYCLLSIRRCISLRSDWS